MNHLLKFRKDNKEKRKELWKLIKYGWSVALAAYNNKKEQFEILLTDDPWPDITVPCDRCGTRYSPQDIYFKPFPSTSALCRGCK